MRSRDLLPKEVELAGGDVERVVEGDVAAVFAHDPAGRVGDRECLAWDVEHAFVERSRDPLQPDVLEQVVTRDGEPPTIVAFLKSWRVVPWRMSGFWSART